MCILFIRTNPSPKEGEYRLIIATNRDEFFKRPAKEAFLCPETKIIGGRDLEDDGRGMWAGLRLKDTQKTLCFSCLLNVTGEEIQTGVKSRGQIVSGYLKSDEPSIEYFDNLTKKDKYNAFNLVNVELNKNGVNTYFMSKNPDQICNFSGEQVLAFSNSPVNRPLTKVSEGRVEFEILTQFPKAREELKKDLLQFLKSTEKHLPDPELQRRASDVFEHRCAIFVEIQKIYGTRTHTIILVDRDWNVEYYEETMESPINVDNIVWKKNSFKFNM
ncbi:hypothetical protein HHI36_021078 [Cryptolaemus montrouzieri]|uniref:Uncharacterized protein n=1 Tax=Cryptolaemus montrouzieri TaxID=559131 RepID=A0ABD2MVM4_9CUCU